MTTRKNRRNKNLGKVPNGSKKGQRKKTNGRKKKHTMLFTFRFTIPATSPSAYLEARIDQVFVTDGNGGHHTCKLCAD